MSTNTDLSNGDIEALYMTHMKYDSLTSAIQLVRAAITIDRARRAPQPSADRAPDAIERDRRILLDTIYDLGATLFKCRDWLADKPEALRNLNVAIATAGVRRADRAPADGAGDEARRQLSNALRTAWHISGVVQQRKDIADVIEKFALPLAGRAPTAGDSPSPQPEPQDELESRWVALLDAANVYLSLDTDPGIMIQLGDKQTWLGLGTKAQLGLMCDGRSGADIERAALASPQPGAHIDTKQAIANWLCKHTNLSAESSARAGAALAALFAIPQPGVDEADRVIDSIEAYAENYDSMARISSTGKVHCTIVAADLRNNIIPLVRAALTRR